MTSEVLKLKPVSGKTRRRHIEKNGLYGSAHRADPNGMDLDDFEDLSASSEEPDLAHRRGDYSEEEPASPVASERSASDGSDKDSESDDFSEDEAIANHCFDLGWDKLGEDFSHRHQGPTNECRPPADRETAMLHRYEQGASFA